MVALYFAISLLSAFVLFSIQPIAAKAVLPVLGGAPFVWNGCMLFFQALLLGGYVYAHGMGRHAGYRAQVKIHMALLVVALAVFPASIGEYALTDAAQHPMLWLMLALAASVGLPFFALSATAPLVQS